MDGAQKLLLSRFFVGGGFFLLGLVVIRWRHSVWRCLKNFFSETGTALDLAVFRIVFFGFLLYEANTWPVLWFSRMPPELLFPPTGLGWLLPHLPINEPAASSALFLFNAFCVCAMAGLFTRFSAALTTILGVYIFGLFVFFGARHHEHHHLIWFSLILAVSPCADVLSCDALRAAFKRADRGVIEAPGPSTAYALPLRWIWLLLGLVYFFPGFWKAWDGGIDWVRSDNLKWMMYNSLQKSEGWLPSFRIDLHPRLLKLSALWTVIFEVSFLFLIFFRRWRALAAVGGLVFHNMTNAFMRILFIELQIMYVSFVPWQELLGRLGRRLFPEDMHVLYDGNCKLCKRTMASFRALDLFGRITYVNALDAKQVAAHGLDRLDAHETLKNMHTVKGPFVWKGFYAYRALSARMPVFWPVLPFLYLWPVPWFGKKVYQKVADSRTCNIPHKEHSVAAAAEGTGDPRWRPIMFTGTALFVINFFLGSIQCTQSWPFACYPTFSWRQGDIHRTIWITASGPNGAAFPVGKGMTKMKGSQWIALLGSIRLTQDPEKQERQLKALGELLIRDDERLKNVSMMQFYEIKNTLDPERRSENPLEKKLLLEWRPGS